MIGWMVLFIGCGWLLAFLFRGNYHIHPRAAVHGVNVRTIGQAVIAYGNEHDVFQPEALRDIYSFAAELARYGLKAPSDWLSRADPATELYGEQPTTILTPGSRTEIDPRFQGAPLAIAVALYPSGTRIQKMPATTPVAWTRGLRSDGTWAPDSPLGRDVGGVIVFIGGNLERYRAIDGRLVSFSGHLTSNILDTLPPGTRVSEFVPSPEMSQRIVAAHRVFASRLLHEARGRRAWALLMFALALVGAVALTSPRPRVWVRGFLIIGGGAAAAAFWWALMENWDVAAFSGLKI